MKSKTIVIIVHILGIALFLYLPVLFAPRDISIADMFKQPRGLADIAVYVLLVIYFYINYFLLVPGLYFNKKYGLYAVFTLLFFTIIFMVSPLIMMISPVDMPGEPGHGPGPDDFFGLRHNLLLVLVVFVLSLMLRINNRWKLAEQERISAELSHLKAQINPHFLFNTLNSIYSLAIDKSDETPEAVVRLSGMMRYVISEADKDMVELEKEIKYICDYIDLQKIRLGTTTQLDFKVEGDPMGKRIAPLILIPFVENAFKYGVNPEKSGLIQIRIKTSDGRLEMMVKNDKVNLLTPDEMKSGLGIQNTRNRLKHLYASRHLIDIRETDKDFTVILNLILE